MKSLISLHPENQKARAEGPYILTIQGRSLWPISFFFHDMISRRNLLARALVAPKMETRVTKERLDWKFSLMDFNRIFGKNYDLKGIEYICRPYLHNEDFLSEDTLTYLANSQSRFRHVNLGRSINPEKTDPRTIDYYEWRIFSSQVKSSELFPLVKESERGNVRFKAVTFMDEDKERSSFVSVRHSKIPLIEKRLSEHPNPILLNYKVGSLLEKLVEKDPPKNTSNEKQLRKHYLPAYELFKEIEKRKDMSEHERLAYRDYREFRILMGTDLEDGHLYY